MTEKTLRVFLYNYQYFIDFVKNDTGVIIVKTNQLPVELRTPYQWFSSSEETPQPLLSEKFENADVLFRYIHRHELFDYSFFKFVFNAIFTGLKTIQVSIDHITGCNNDIFVDAFLDFLNKNAIECKQLSVPAILVVRYKQTLHEILCKYTKIEKLEITGPSINSHNTAVQSLDSRDLLELLENTFVERLECGELSVHLTSMLLFIGKSNKCLKLKEIYWCFPDLNGYRGVVVTHDKVEETPDNFTMLTGSNLNLIHIHTNGTYITQFDMIGRIIQGCLKLEDLQLTSLGMRSPVCPSFISLLRGHQSLKHIYLPHASPNENKRLQKICDVNTHRHSQSLSALASPYAVKRLRKDDCLLVKMLPLDIIRSVGKFLDRIPPEDHFPED